MTPEDKLDSGMKPDDPGIPMSMGEVEAIIKHRNMDLHVLMAMKFLVARVKRLEETVRVQRDFISTQAKRGF